MLVVDRAFRRQVLYVTPAARTALAGRVCDQIERDVGAVLPPYALHLPAADVLAACWAIIREPSVGTAVPRATKEAVAAAVSGINACPYCVDVHTTTMYALAQPGTGAAIASGQDDQITDPALRDVVSWARATRSPGSAILATRPFPDAATAEIIGTAVGYHYINRMVNVFLVDSPFPFSSRQNAKRGLKRVLAPGMRRTLLRAAHPGDALALVPDTEQPHAEQTGAEQTGFEWATTDPTIAATFARSAAVFAKAGRRALPEPVRQLVAARLQQWQGEDPPISRRWVDDALASLPERQRPAGRLALLTALAPYQVDAQVIDEFRSTVPGGDEQLITAAAWASFAAARRVGQWIQTSAPPVRT